ncbi:MAG: hypothetical protein V7752_03740 [Halopseudomonas sp.]
MSEKQQLKPIPTVANIQQPQVSLALTDPGMLTRLLELGPQPCLRSCLKRLGWKDIPLAVLDAERDGGFTVARVHIGNEFCERLLPTPAQIKTALQQTELLGVEMSLLTPLLTDSGIKRLSPLLELLPDGTEVVVNDWGTLRLVRRHYPALTPLLGRLLYKMIKDPRLPSAQWTKLHPHSGQSKPFHQLLARFGVEAIEMDLPPFTQPEQFQIGELGLSVHLPYGYVVKGRMCRIGSLGLDDKDKFVAGHACQKECLDYVTPLERPNQAADQPAQDLVGFQRGNTQFYRYSSAMEASLVEAVKQGSIKCLVFAGDWNEHRCPSEPS